jgi:hypothetical protein
MFSSCAQVGPNRDADDGAQVGPQTHFPQVLHVGWALVGKKLFA